MFVQRWRSYIVISLIIIMLLSMHEILLLFSAVCSSSSLVATGVLSHSLPRAQKSSFSPLKHGRKRLRRSSSVTDLTQHNKPHPLHPPLLSQKSLQFDDPIASNNEIERIIAKIQQDNKILAELDKNPGEFSLYLSLSLFHTQHLFLLFLFNLFLLLTPSPSLATYLPPFCHALKILQ